MPTPASFAALLTQALVIAAAAFPSLLAYNAAPSPTFLNQALAFGLWAGFVIVSLPASPRRGPWPVWAALALLVVSAAWAWGPGALPASLALSAIGTLIAAAVLVAGGAGARARPDAESLFAAFCWAWVVAGVLNVIVAFVQVFLPGLPDGDWIAASGTPGRAVGNLRQPNHLSSLLLWFCIAAVALLELGRLSRRAAGMLLVMAVFTVVLTASRTGLVSVLLLALWGLLDRKLTRGTRGLLVAAPLMYLLSGLAMAQWAALTQHAFGAAERLSEGSSANSRLAIWRDTLVLIREQPWFGVGFGEFNFAWTLTPSAQRPVAFFDHTHNLPLHLAVELGLPLATLVMALLLWALWRGFRRAWATPRGLGVAQRCAMLMVLMIGLHSLLEYPLWYSYFLLPAAWVWGFALYGDAQAEPAAPAAPAAAMRSSPALSVAALAVVVGAGLSVLDYTRVMAIFNAAPGDSPLEQRIAAGQRSWFFAHHADYASVTSGIAVTDPAQAFDRAPHYLLDTRLMLAWAQSLAARGELDAARHIVERLREFRKVDATEFFAACDAGDVALAASAAVSSGPAASAASAAASATERPFQCAPPSRVPPWRSFAAEGF